MTKEEQIKRDISEVKIFFLQEEIEQLEFQIDVLESKLKEERFNRIVLSVVILFFIAITSIILTL